MESLIINLSEDEKSLLLELTDFGKSLPELISEVHSENPSGNLVDKYDFAINLVTSLVSKGLVSLCELDANPGNEVYSVNESNLITSSGLTSFLNDPYNWVSSISRDSKKQYELAPTDKGEAMLDEIFKVSKTN